MDNKVMQKLSYGLFVLTAKEGDTITALVIGVNPETYVINLSVKKYDQVQNRKVVA